MIREKLHIPDQTAPLFRKADPTQIHGLNTFFRILISHSGKLTPLVRDIRLLIPRLRSGQVLLSTGSSTGLSTTRSGLGEVPPPDPICCKFCKTIQSKGLFPNKETFIFVEAFNKCRNQNLMLSF